MGEPPAAGDRRHGVNGGVRVLQIAMGALETHTPQVLQRRRVQMTAERVLNRPRGDVGDRGYLCQSDVAIGVVVDELDRAAQQRRLTGGPFDVVVHFAYAIYPKTNNRKPARKQPAP